MRVKLNKKVVEGATYQGPGACYLWDTHTANLALRVYPSGRKAFVITYRVRGRQRFYTIDGYGPLTLDEARTEAMELLAQARRGQDPAADRLTGRRSPTMRDLRDRHLEDAEGKLKPATFYRARRHWDRHVLPRLGRRKVADIARADVAAVHAEMARTPVEANHVRSLLSTAFNLAEVWGWRAEGSNPCRNVKRYRVESRERFLSEEELGRLAEALTAVELEHPEWVPAAAAIRLLVLTGCRRNEILRLRWEEVDLEGRCLHLADSKTGPKDVILNTGALEVLAGIERVEGNPYVIVGSRSGRPPARLERPWGWVRDRAKLPGVRLHDLRHTYASFGVGSGFNLPVVGRLLGHSQVSTTQRYAHLADDPVRRAAETIGATLTAAMERRPKAEVVPIAK